MVLAPPKLVMALLVTTMVLLLAAPVSPKSLMLIACVPALRRD